MYVRSPGDGSYQNATHLRTRTPTTMEFNFALLVAAALAGMVAKLALGWNPQALLGAMTAVLLWEWLTLQLLGLAFESDQRVVQDVTNLVIERLVFEFGSLVVGEIAGVYAATIFGVTRRWLRDW